MKKIIQYNLEILTCILTIVVLFSALNWNELSSLQQMTAIFMILYTLHEWEESRFPGGFYRIFFSKCTIDPNVSEATMHFPVAIYLLVILLIPYMLGEIVALALIPLVLAIFEGLIHSAGIVIHQLKKPYSPGMITAWIMFGYSIYMISQLNQEFNLGVGTWVAGIILTFLSFFIMETQFLKTVGITIKEFQTSMKNHMMERLNKK